MKQRGFTLVELVTVFVILAVSAAVVTPVYLNYRDQAVLSSERQVVAAVQQSIANKYTRMVLNGANVYPTNLDVAPPNTDASSSNPLFSNVLSVPITSNWKKGGSALSYVSPTGVTYIYDPNKGSFTAGIDGAPILSSGYSLDELLAMTPEQLAGLSLDEIHALTGEQIAALSYKQFEAIAAKLSPAQIPLARPDQIAMLSAETYGLFTQNQLASLTQAQVDERAYADHVRSLPYNEIRNLQLAGIKYLTTDQIAAIPNSYAMGQIPQELRAAFTEDQIQAINTTDISIGYLTADQRELLTTNQIANLGSYGDIRHVPASRIGEVTTDLIGSIPNSYAMGQIPDNVRAEFTTEQIQAINTTDVSIGYLTAAQRESLTTDQIASLGTYGDIRHVPASRITEVSTSLIATIPNSYAMGQIPDSVRAGFTIEQIQSVNTADVSIGYLTASQRESLTTSQIASLGTYGDIRHVPASRIGEVTTSLIATIPNSYAMGQIPDQVRAGFTAEQIQSINTTDVSIGYLSANQRESLTTNQIASLGTYGDIRHVPASRIGEVTTSLIATIPDSYSMGQIPADVRANLSATQVQAIDTTNVSIGYLTTSQREALTTIQIASLGGYGDIRHVPASRITEVTANLIATIPNSYAMGQIPDSVRAGFTTAQVQSINTANISIGYLTNGQRENLTVQQIAGLGSSGDIRHVPTSRIAEVSTSLVGQISDAYQFNQISTAGVQAFTQNQVMAISTDFYDSVKHRLTPEQQAWRP